MIKFKGKYFDTNKNAVHVDDADVQEMIDRVLEDLIVSREKTDFCFQATGDTLVAGVKWDAEGEIEIMVTQKYNHACLLRDEYGNYQPVDWLEEQEKDELLDKPVDELVTEIMLLRKELEDQRKAQYNPRREV
jgi:hypothetical protein